jgi:hypothetical protein
VLMTHKPNKLNKESQHSYIPIPAVFRLSEIYVKKTQNTFSVYFTVSTRHNIVLLRFDQITRLIRLQRLPGTSCHIDITELS